MEKTRILIVDDDPIARQLYSDCLSSAGYEVEAVHDAQQACQILDRLHFDVVVTDLILPSEDGLAVLAEAKRRDPGIEVILITAVDRVDPAVRAIKSGAADYLVKPVSAESLLLSVSRSVATHQLLQENALLRQHLALVETGQRLATTLEKEHLFPLAAHAFAQNLSANSVLLFDRTTEGKYLLTAFQGIDPQYAQKIGDQAVAALPHLHNNLSSVEILEIDGQTWHVLRAEETGQVQGICLLLNPTLQSTAWSNAHFLARHFALAMQNIRRLNEAEDLVYMDDLTRLYNLRFLHLVLDREITNSRQTGTPFSVLFMDLDHFKEINDSYGHLAGSKLLVEVGALLKGSVRDIDVACRYGGDEYVVVLLNTDTGGALKVGERIRRSIEARRFLSREGLAISLTSCIGVASYPEHAQDKHSILDSADRAMYRGKQTTRNIIYVASPKDPSVRAC